MLLDTEQTVKIVTIILEDPKDWEDWYNLIKLTARNLKVWDYVDPKGTMEIEEPVEPQLSDYTLETAVQQATNTAQGSAEAQLAAESLSRLTATNRDVYRWEYERWEKKELKWRTHEAALAKIANRIAQTVARKHHHVL